MTFQPSIFLIPYLLFLLCWLIFSLIAIFHMFKFGFKNFTTFFATFIFVAISILLLATSYNYLNQIDWGINITILEGLFNSNYY